MPMLHTGYLKRTRRDQRLFMAKKSNAGRPQTQIDQETFEKLCAIFCTLDDIAGWFKCSQDTIERWCKRTYKENFADIYKKKSAPGRISLRRKQFEIANAGNVGMLIWLGKNHLGQSEKVEHAANESSIFQLNYKLND